MSEAQGEAAGAAPADGAQQDTAKAGTGSEEVLVGGTGDAAKAADDTAGGGAKGETPGDHEGTGETKDGDKTGKAEGDETAESGKQPTDGEDTVPEDGKYTIELPEGSVPLDEEMLEQFGPRAKELGITQKQAQGLAEFLAERRVAEQDAAVENYAKEVRGWKEQAENDTEIGRDKLEETTRLGNEAVRKFGDDSLLTLLRDNGLGNHPAILRFTSRVGRALADDTFAAGTRVEAETRVEDRWYSTGKT